MPLDIFLQHQFKLCITNKQLVEPQGFNYLSTQLFDTLVFDRKYSCCPTAVLKLYVHLTFNFEDVRLFLKIALCFLTLKRKERNKEISFKLILEK